MEIKYTPHRILQCKRIWQIDSCYKCALVGTCLTRIELRKLAKERIFAIEPGDDYQLHAGFIRISNHNDPRGKALHKYLARKYQAHSKKYLAVTTDEAIKDLWEQDLKEGLFASAWWSILTHPTASGSLVATLYGAIHMVGHDLLNNHHRFIMHSERLATKVAMLEEVLSSERQYYRHEKRQLQIEVADLKQSVGTLQGLEKNNATLRVKNLQLQQELESWQSGTGARNRQQEIDGLRQNNNTLLGKVDQLSAELTCIQEAYTRANELLAQTKSLQLKQQRHEAEQAKEIATLEMLLLGHVAQVPCSQCADHNTTNCPGRSLCGKTVLYVGGLNNLIPHYRQLVEQCGGRFLHHDGGKEASRTLLPKMLTSADAVFCPIDCVSHDACTCVKKMCKRYQKPFVLMRSAGLSSLAKGLSEIVQ